MNAESPAARHVLVVDDQPTNVELARALLELEGLEVEVAIDARQADAAVRRRPPALVLLDIQLPGEDGLALLARWRASPTTAGLCVVAFTAFAMAGDRDRCLAAGCDGYISKPIDVASFGHTIRAFLDRPPIAASTD